MRTVSENYGNCKFMMIEKHLNKTKNRFGGELSGACSTNEAEKVTFRDFSISFGCLVTV